MNQYAPPRHHGAEQRLFCEKRLKVWLKTDSWGKIKFKTFLKGAEIIFLKKIKA